MYQNKALSSVESHLLGDKIRNEEAIRPGAVVLLSSEPRAASEKVQLCSRYTVTQKKNKTARGLGSIGGSQFYTKQDFLAERFSIPTLSAVEYSLGHLFFFYRILRFMIFQSSPKINRMLITRLICIQGKFTPSGQLASSSKFCSLKFFIFFSTTEVITCSKVINAFKR